MIASITIAIHNPDGTRAMYVASEEQVPDTSPDPLVNGGHTLMRLHELIEQAQDTINRQAQVLGVADKMP